MIGKIRRREFIRQVSAGVIGGALAPAILRGQVESRTSTRPHGETIKNLPTRRLGRIGIQVPVLSFGTAPMGHAFYEPEPFEKVANAAIQAGLCYIDTSPVYDVAEERLKPVIANHRKKVFLVTKSMARTRDRVLRDLEGSFKRLGTDHVELAHIHNVGGFSQQEAIGKGGALDGFLEAKKRGWIKYIGCSGHLRPNCFVPVIETGLIDLVMAVMNFVDRHTYGFEEKVLPVARKHDCAIACMKVYGGVPEVWGGYRKLQPGRLAGDEYRQDAIDYALSIPGVSTCVVGIKSIAELHSAIEAVRRYQPLEGARREALLAKGAVLAKQWGPRFGPVS